MKNSFSLLEIIITLIISSIVIIYSTLFTKELSFENRYNQELEIDKINFLATKVFIEKNKYNISNLQFSNGNLYFENNLLLKDVKEFNITKTSKQITIYINFKDKIIQTWEFSS
ncbi:hypothetical protein ACOL2Y_08960 [Aliarcobacter butzleri]